jgi:hypothetical protein
MSRQGLPGHAIARLRGLWRALLAASMRHGKQGFAVVLVAAAGCGGGGGESGNPVAAPISLAYASPQTYVVGNAIAQLRPSIGSLGASYSVAPPLPAGLALDATSGFIAGTPTTPAPAAGYVITAQNASGSTSFTLSITVLANVLRAFDDVASTVKQIPVGVRVMDNDVPGPNLPVRVASITQPASGTASIVPTTAGDVIAYTPNASFVGTDTLTYTLSDAGGATSSATVTVTVSDIDELRLHANGRVARLVTPLASVWTTSNANANARAVAARLYSHLKDDFDFIVLIGSADANAIFSSYEGIHIPARNDVQGIGLALSDNTAAFGSAGRLRGVVQLNRRNGLRNGPSLHELLHAWANYAADTGLAAHWNFSSSGGGQLGGFDGSTLRDLGGGRFQATSGQPGRTGFGQNANGGNSVPYSDVELYLMGLRAAAGVPDLMVANSPAFVDAANGIFSATGFTTHTIDSIVARLGPRVPDVASSPKNFKLLVVVLARAELGDSEFNSLDEDVRLFGLAGDDGRPNEFNFWEATRGVGTLTVDGLAASLR